MAIIIQQRQAYAAAAHSPLKDNLRANLGNRNHHLNQQGNCIRTDGCSTSDVGQGSLGNDNSVTGFADQSSRRITKNANSNTEGRPTDNGIWEWNRSDCSIKGSVFAKRSSDWRGWERIDKLTASQNREIIKENKENNAWVVTGSSTFQPITFKAFAECASLVP
ncbi:MAG TPA: hypothetical protein VF884_03105 [Nitrososphaeraceae archaeon]